MDVLLFGGALGGIGLFLLGMRLMTGGLKIASGAMLREFLSRWTRTRLRGLWSGILITSIVQSSGAVTIAAIGFANAGILTLGEAMWLVFGSNVGTTMTGWIVALVGFDIRIEAFALPLLGIGMFLSLFGTSTRRGALGEAIAGFGVFFLGIATLKSTFAGLGESLDLAAFAGTGLLNDAVFILAGVVLTTLVQSSSAVIAIALTAASGHLFSIESGAALVIGANIGTTSTALLAVLGATSNAKRVAIAHVAFNVLTATAALAMLPLMLLVVQETERLLTMDANPASTLALFHTAFNVLGVALIWLVSGRLERWLAGRFVTAEENESRPRYLDSTSLALPAMAVNSILLELRRVSEIALGIAKAAFTEPGVSPERLGRRAEVIHRLNDAIVRFVQSLNAATRSEAVAEALQHPIRALWHFMEIAGLSLEAAALHRQLESLPPAYRARIADYAGLVAAELDSARLAFADPGLELPRRETTEPVYQRVKAEILAAASRGQITAGAADTALEAISDMKLTIRHLEHAGRRIGALAAIVADDEDEQDEEEVASEGGEIAEAEASADDPEGPPAG